MAPRLGPSLIAPEEFFRRGTRYNSRGDLIPPETADTSSSALDLARSVAPTLGIDTAPLDLAQRVAPSLGIDLTAHRTPDTAVKGVDITPDFGEAGDKQTNQVELGGNPMISKAPGLLKSALDLKAQRIRTIRGEGSLGDVASTGVQVAARVARTAAEGAAGILAIPKDMITAGKEAQDLPGRVESDTGEISYPRSEANQRLADASIATALTLAGARAFGAPSRGTLSVGAGPLERPPKGYSRDVPPPKTTPLPDIAALKRPESDWHQRIEDLDRRNAPDEQYRLILSAGSKEIQKNGGPRDAASWRDKIVGYINKAASKNVPATVDPAHDLARQAAPELGLPAPEAMPRRQEGQGVAAVKIGDQVWTGAAHTDALEKAVEHFDKIKQPFPEAALDQNSFGIVDSSGKFAPSSTDMVLKKAPVDPAHDLARQAAPELGLPKQQQPVQPWQGEGKLPKGVNPARMEDFPDAKPEPPGESAVVAYRGEVFTGATHHDALNKAIDKYGQKAADDIDANVENPEVFQTGYVGSTASGADAGKFESEMPLYHEYRDLIARRRETTTNSDPAHDLARQAAPELGLPAPGHLPEGTDVGDLFGIEMAPEPFTASPPPAAAAQAAGHGVMPPPGMFPPPPGGTPPTPPRRGAPTPPFQSGEAPAPFLDNAPDISTGPMHPARIREMENDLFATKSSDRGRKEILQTQTLPRIKKALARTFGREAAAVDKRLYHDIENGRAIEPRAQSYYDQTIRPRRDANLNKWRELQQYNMPDLEAGVENPNYMHRMRIGKTRGMDVASGADEASLAGTVGYGKGKLSTRPSSARKRTILAMEDEAGNRRVVEGSPGSDAVYVWENGKRRAEPGGLIRTVEEHFRPGEAVPGRTTLEKPVVAKVKDGGLTDPYYKPSREIPDQVTQDRVTEPKLINDKFRKGSEFVDQNKKRWFIKDATTEEIHNAGVRDIKRAQVSPGQFRLTYGEPIRFYESALASTVMNGLELDRAIATAKFRKKWQEAPEFKTHSVDVHDASPEQRRDWETIKAPGWEGRYYEPTYAEPIIDHLVGQGYRVPFVDRASNFATRWLFKTGIGSIAHGWNEMFQRMLARGVTGNLNVVSRSVTALKAFDETWNKGPIWQDYRNKGASFPSDGMHKHTVEHDVMRALGMKLVKEPGFIAQAKRWALTPNELLESFSQGLGKAVFEYGDFIALQHGLELERRGFTRDQAILRMNKVLPTYRIPSRIIGKGQGGRFAAKMTASPSFAQFGRFTYARFKALSSIVEDIAGKGKSWRDRRDGLDRLLGIVLTFGFIAPFVDKKLQEASGDKDLHFLWGGSLGMISRAIRMAEDALEGRKSGTDAVLDGLTSSVNLGAFIKEAIQQYSGRDLYNDRQFVAPTDPDAQNIAERAAHIGSTFFAPTQAFIDPKQYFFEDPLRLSTSRPYDPRPSSRGGAKRLYGQEQGRFERLPGPMQEILRFGRSYGGANR